jgi:hypothetical protein
MVDASVTCVECGFLEVFPVSDDSTVPDRLAIFEQLGWRLDRGHGMVCPDCVEDVGVAA